jgi:hypothetical protein
LKKRSKKLFPVGACAPGGAACSRWLPETGVAQRREKFFGSFFQKRTSFVLPS